MASFHITYITYKWISAKLYFSKGYTFLEVSRVMGVPKRMVFFVELPIQVDDFGPGTLIWKPPYITRILCIYNIANGFTFKWMI